jgi:hypothetical protein
VESALRLAPFSAHSTSHFRSVHLSPQLNSTERVAFIIGLEVRRFVNNRRCQNRFGRGDAHGVYFFRLSGCVSRRVFRGSLVVATAITSIVRLVVPSGLCNAGRTLAASILRDLVSQAPRLFPLGITLSVGTGCAGLTLCLELLVVRLNHDLLEFSRSGSSVRGDSELLRWVRLYWFCHVTGMDASMIAARSASLNGMFPFFVVGTALGLSFNVGRYLT